jgi:hypothetical protein
MTTDPMTPNQFLWFFTLVCGGVSALWFVSDARKLVRVLKLDASDPSVRDQRFGYAIGLVIASIGMIGSARGQGWI